MAAKPGVSREVVGDEDPVQGAVYEGKISENEPTGYSSRERVSFAFGYSTAHPKNEEKEPTLHSQELFHPLR